jgi:hypothetical protein
VICEGSSHPFNGHQFLKYIHNLVKLMNRHNHANNICVSEYGVLPLYGLDCDMP